MTEEAPADRSSRPDLPSVLWHALVAPQTLLALLGLLVVTMITAGLVPQIPLSERNNSLQWLAAQSDLAGRAWIRSLHLYDICHSLWIRLLLAILGAVLMIRLAQAAEIAWRASTPGQWRSTHLRLWPRGQCEEQVSLLAPLEAVSESEQHLSGHGYRCSPLTDGPVHTYVASRRAWALWAAPMAYTGYLLALVGVLLLTTWGWQSGPWPLGVGESRTVGADGAMAVRIEAFELRQDHSSRVAAVTQVSWRAGERELGRSTITGSHPASLHGLTVRQLGYVPVLSIRGWDENGHALLLQEDPGPGLPRDVEVVFPDPEARPVLLLEKLDRLLVLSFEAAGRTGKPSLHLALTSSAGTGQVPLGTLHESGSVSFEGSQLQVDMTFRPLLQADHLPGGALVVAGAAIALIGLAVIWLARPKLALGSAAAEPGGGTRVRTLHIPSQREYGRAGALAEDAEPLAKTRLAVRVPGILHGATRVIFLLLSTAAAAGAAWAWRTTGSLYGHAVPAGWPLASVLLAAMSLLAWDLGSHGARWAAILVTMSAAAVAAGFFV